MPQPVLHASFLKILESFILKRLKEETSFSDTQYGGLKGCGVDHFLVKTWDEVLSSLEDDRACVNLISVDFEKAFNRIDHLECLKALRTMGPLRLRYGLPGPS